MSTDRFSIDLTDAMNAGRWHEATHLLIQKVDSLYRELRELRDRPTATLPLSTETDTTLVVLAALVTKIEEMEKPINDCITFAWARGFKYTGPNWTDELAAAKRVLGIP